VHALGSVFPTAGVQSMLLPVVEEHGLPSGQIRAPNCVLLTAFDANETLVVDANIAIDTAPISNDRAEKFRRADTISPRFKTDEVVPPVKLIDYLLKRPHWSNYKCECLWGSCPTITIK
jgi:hypothetical protein